jgi:hypothetical protein
LAFTLHPLLISEFPSQAEPGTERDELYIHMEQGNETLTTYHAGE